MARTTSVYFYDRCFLQQCSKWFTRIYLSNFKNGSSRLFAQVKKRNKTSFFIDRKHFCRILRDKNRESSNVRVGFATFDKQIHFYNIKVRRFARPTPLC